MINSQLLEKEPGLDNLVQYYSFRGNCEHLNEMWAYIKRIDDLAKQSTEYAEIHNKDDGKKEDKVFMNAFGNIFESWITEMERYEDVIAKLCLSGDIIVRASNNKKGTVEETPLRKAYIQKIVFPFLSRNLEYRLHCGYCNTEIPKIKYKDWNFS